MLIPAKRLKELDILRATAIFLIVFYHLPVDLALPISQDPAVQTALSYVILFGMALFFFLSGFSIDLNNRGITTQTDVARFFYKRAKRIYPLYWVALTLSFLAILVIIPALHVSLLPTLQASLLGQQSHGLSGSDVIICFLGAQVLLYPRFIDMPNRWFIGTILICYLLYPVIAYFSKNDIRKVALVSAILFLCLVAAQFTFNIVGDVHLYIYFCVFAAGIIANRANLFYSGALKSRLVASCALLVTFMIFAQTALHYPREGASLDAGLSLNNLAGSVAYLVYLVAISLLFVVVAFYIAKACAPRLSNRAAKFFFFAAVASYAVFLFHQQFVVGLRLALQRVLPFGAVEIAAIIVFVGLPALFTISYYEQREEPEAVRKILEFIRPSILRERLRYTFLKREK